MRLRIPKEDEDLKLSLPDFIAKPKKPTTFVLFLTNSSLKKSLRVLFDDMIDFISF